MSHKRAKKQRRAISREKKQHAERKIASYRQTLFDLFDQAAHPSGNQEPPSSVQPSPSLPLSDSQPDHSLPVSPGYNRKDEIGPLGIALSAAVPLRLLEFYDRGYVEPWEFGSAQAFGRILAAEGDKLLFRSKKEGESARLFNGLSRTIALLSFFPGGISVFGQRFDARAFLSAWMGTETAEIFCQDALQRFFDEMITVIPATCSLAQDNMPLGTWNVIHWFETASDEQLEKLRAQEYRNDLIDNEDQQENRAALVIQEIFKQADWEVLRATKKEPEAPETIQRLIHARLLLKARDERQSLRCSIEPDAAEKWLFLFRHELVVGRW